MKVIAIFALCLILVYGQSDEERRKYPELYSGYFEGDMLINGHDLRNGLLNVKRRWPKGQIPYKLAEDITENQKNILNAAFNEYHQKTCLRFIVANETTTSYVYIQKNETNKCYSEVGKVGDRRQLLNLGDGCFLNFGSVLHEILHTIGFLHEHSRTDRDDYVQINWENIPDQDEFNFVKYENTFITDFGVEYDYGSIMHYSRYAFSNNGKETIVPIKDPNAEIGQRRGLSPRDIEKINRMYVELCEK